MLFSVAAAAGRRAAGCARLWRAVSRARRPLIARCSRVERCCVDHADARCTAHQQIAAHGFAVSAAPELLLQTCCVVAAAVDAALQSVDDVSTIAGGGEKFSAILLSVLRAPRLW